MLRTLPLLALLAVPLGTRQPARTLDVKAFGATGDGHTIDSDAINKAKDLTVNRAARRSY